ncbi:MULTISPECIES: DUF1826 domain-containing protein [unclassified Sphingomonas]|nr:MULTISPECIES: DUF1826 domain-containing protein [unclassified Sphingomonas]
MDARKPIAYRNNMLLHNTSQVLANPSPLLSDPTSGTPSHVRIGETNDDLRAIRSADVNLAIWRRSPPVTLNEAMLDAVDDLAIVRPIDLLATMLPADLRTAGYPDATAALLGADVATLADAFARIVGATRVSIRLDVVETDACRRFHADYVTARLICTYVGPGTQWLDTIDAAALGEGADVDTLTIRSLATGDVGLFKGWLWSPDAPIVHRSPPILTTGERRLLLVIDPAPAADPS